MQISHQMLYLYLTYHIRLSNYWT